MRFSLQKLLLFIVGLAVLGALVYSFLPQPVDVDVADVTRGPLQVTIDEEGRTRIKDRYTMYAPLTGQLQRVQLRAGDEVTRGETLLATIQPTAPELLDSRTRAEAHARVKSREAAVRQATAALEKTRAALEFAESDLSRAQRLSRTKAISQQELEEAQLRYRTQTEEFRTHRFAEEIARHELEVAQAALVSQMETHHPNTQVPIYSPITGRVLQVFQESASVVTPGAQLMELGDPADLELLIDVLSSDAVQIQPGTPVAVEHWGGDFPLRAEVRLVEPSAFTKISALGVEEQRVNVIADLLDPPEKRPTLGHAYRVEARIVIWESDDVLKVPTGALFRHAQQWAVFRLVQGRAVLQPIRIGQRNTLHAEVLEGLSPGDRVVVHPGDQVRDGVAVTVRS